MNDNLYYKNSSDNEKNKFMKRKFILKWSKRDSNPKSVKSRDKAQDRQTQNIYTSSCLPLRQCLVLGRPPSFINFSRVTSIMLRPLLSLTSQTLPQV